MCVTVRKQGRGHELSHQAIGNTYFGRKQGQRHAHGAMPLTTHESTRAGTARKRGQRHTTQGCQCQQVRTVRCQEATAPSDCLVYWHSVDLVRSFLGGLGLGLGLGAFVCLLQPARLWKTIQDPVFEQKMCGCCATVQMHRCLLGPCEQSTHQGLDRADVRWSMRARYRGSESQHRVGCFPVYPRDGRVLRSSLNKA